MLYAQVTGTSKYVVGGHSHRCMWPHENSYLQWQSVFVAFIVEYSHYYVVYLLYSKFGVATELAQFVALA